MSNYKDYSGLHKTYEYDHEKATLLAEAMTELVELKKRMDYLGGLFSDNANLKKFIWASTDGKVTALHDLETDHLINILQYLRKQGRTISPQLEAEARSRNLALPAENLMLEPGEGSDADYDWMEDN